MRISDWSSDVCSSDLAAVAPSALARSRAAPTTSAPRAASARAVSTPSPAETPVTRMRLPRRSTPASTSSVVDLESKRDMGGTPEKGAGEGGGLQQLAGEPRKPVPGTQTEQRRNGKGRS